MGTLLEAAHEELYGVGRTCLQTPPVRPADTPPCAMVGTPTCHQHDEFATAFRVVSDDCVRSRPGRLATAPATSRSSGSVMTLAVRLGSLCRMAA